jgi:hypothetical protein
MRTSHVPVMHCEKMPVTYMSFRQHAVIEFTVSEGNSAADIYERRRGVYGDVCLGASSVRRWVKHFKDGNVDITDQPRCSRPRTAATERNKQNSSTSSSKTEGWQRKCNAAWRGAPCSPGDDGDFGISESLFPLVSPFSYGCRGTQNGWELLSHPPFSPDLASSDYQLFGPLKGHLGGHRYETDEASQEAVRSGLWGAGKDFYHRGIFKILQRWQKCIDRIRDFVEM